MKKLNNTIAYIFFFLTIISFVVTISILFTAKTTNQGNIALLGLIETIAFFTLGYIFRNRCLTY